MNPNDMKGVQARARYMPIAEWRQLELFFVYVVGCILALRACHCCSKLLTVHSSSARQEGLLHLSPQATVLQSICRRCINSSTASCLAHSQTAQELLPQCTGWITATAGHRPWANAITAVPST
jgi:hypothetical protein